MANHTISSSQLEVHSNSLAFGCLEWEVFAAAWDIWQQIGKQLKWQRGAIEVLTVLLARIGKRRAWMEFSHDDLGSWMWPDHPRQSAKRRAGKYVKALAENQAETGLYAVEVVLGKKTKNDEYLKTKYKLNDAPMVVSAIQTQVLTRDLFAVEGKDFDAGFRRCVQDVLRQFGFRARELQASAKSAKVEQEEVNIYRLPWQDQAVLLLERFGEEFGTLVEDAEDFPPVEWLQKKVTRIMDMSVNQKRDVIARFNKRGV